MKKNLQKILSINFIALFVISFFSYPVHAEFQGFEDIHSNQWFTPFVYELINQKILDTTKTKYLPEANIDRAQALKLVIESSKIETENTIDSIFSDVPNDAWYKKYVMAAYTKGIVRGKSSDIFAPSAFITRAELAEILVKAKNFSTANKCGKTFPDLIGHFGENSLMILYCLSILDGYLDGTMKPDTILNRAETAKFIVAASNPVPRVDAISPGGYSTSLYTYEVEDYENISDQKLIQINKKSGIKQVAITSIQNKLKQFFLKYAEPQNSQLVFFRSYFPETDNPGGALYAFNTSTNQFTWMKSNDIFATNFGVGKSVSPDQTKVIVISVDDNNDGREGLEQKMFLIDLKNDSSKVLVQLSSNETFNQGGFALSASYDLKWIDDNTLQYAIYDQSKKDKNETESFVEYRQIIMSNIE